MTPKEKARELVERYHDEFGMLWYTAKKCALIAVDEILNVRSLKSQRCGYEIVNDGYIEYWQQVKNEIEKL